MDFGARGLLGSQSPLESFRPDQLIVGLALPAIDLGLYVAALAFTSLPRLVAQSVGMVVYPRVAARDSRSDQWRAVVRASMRTAFLVALITAPLMIFMSPLVLFFFGDDFEAAVPLARVLLLASVAHGVRRVVSEGARGAGAPGAGSIAELLSLAVYLPAVLGLIAVDGVQRGNMGVCGGGGGQPRGARGSAVSASGRGDGRTAATGRGPPQPLIKRSMSDATRAA